jgi:hypothetical protein
LRGADEEVEEFKVELLTGLEARWKMRASSLEQGRQWRLGFSVLVMTEGRRRREWMGEVWTAAGTPFYALSSWPRCQVMHGVWRTRGGDGL